MANQTKPSIVRIKQQASVWRIIGDVQIVEANGQLYDVVQCNSFSNSKIAAINAVQECIQAIESNVSPIDYLPYDGIVQIVVQSKHDPGLPLPEYGFFQCCMRDSLPIMTW